jgi:hypothetical protein
MAARLGLHRNQIRRLIEHGVLKEPVAGVLVMTSAAPSWEQRVAIATSAGGDHAVASHRCAARFHGLDGWADFRGVEISSERRFKAAVDACVHQVASLEPGDIVEIGGVRVTNLARTLVDLGAVVGPDQVERALDDARRRGVSLRWIDQTARRLREPGRAGPAVLLTALGRITPGEPVRGSWFEKVVELMLADPRIPQLVRQHVVRDRAGRFVAQLDLAVPSLRHGIEAHSRQFHFGRAAEAGDEDRDHRLSAVGWDVTYLGFASTRRPAETVDLVAAIFEERRRLLEGRRPP